MIGDDWLKVRFADDWRHILAVAVNAYVRDRDRAPDLLQLAGMAEIAVAEARRKRAQLALKAPETEPDQT